MVEDLPKVQLIHVLLAVSWNDVLSWLLEAVMLVLLLNILLGILNILVQEFLISLLKVQELESLFQLGLQIVPLDYEFLASSVQ